MAQTKARTSKSLLIQHSLLSQLKAGDYARGGRIPPERALADQLGVSYMTVRKVINQLVHDGYLFRRVGQGTFVRQDVPEERIQKQIGFLCPAWETPEFTAFAMHLFKIAEANQWQPRMFHYRSWNDRLITDVIGRCDALVVFPTGAPLSPQVDSVFRTGGKPVIFIGSPMYVLGFDSVMGEPEREMDLAIDHLARLGHQRIGLVWQKTEEESATSMTQRTENHWRRRMEALSGSQGIDDLLIAVDVPRFEWPHKAIYDHLTGLFKKNGAMPFSAVVTIIPWVWGTLAAVNDLGLKIPEEISVIAIGDREEANYFRPKLTTVRVSEEEHIRLAWDLIQKRLQNPTRPPDHATVNPELIPGQTTAAPSRVLT
jgi:DNA-binding LacI/PurR family transcriptional regulator